MKKKPSPGRRNVLHDGDEVRARVIGWMPPDYARARAELVRGVVAEVDSHAAMLLVEFVRAGVVCRAWCRRAGATVLRRAVRPRGWRAVEDERAATVGAVAGVSWSPVTY